MEIVSSVARVSFNPLPAVRPGGTQTIAGHVRRELVSIRSRLLGREEPGVRWVEV